MAVLLLTGASPSRSARVIPNEVRDLLFAPPSPNASSGSSAPVILSEAPSGAKSKDLAFPPTQRLAQVLPQSPPAVTQSRAPAAISYALSLHERVRHLVHVSMTLPAGASTRELQLPVWNALYQVKDFAKYIIGDVVALDSSDTPLPIFKTDKTTWRVTNAGSGFRLEYDFYADEPGPFGAQLDRDHAFFNLAWLLMYPIGGRSLPVLVSFADLPRGWHIATAMPRSGEGFAAANYDLMVDSPVEISSFREHSFLEGGAKYRLAIHGDPADYDAEAIQSVARRVVSAAVEWMQDRPFEEFLFLYHFHRGPPGGGMEHAYSTAIDLSARAVRANPESIASITAHEFFHLWNVKRIRPVSLEPVDYSRENFSPALWFCEGATSAVGEYILLRAGLIDEPDYLGRLAEAIATLENRPANRFQSVEQSSLETWLDRYPFYTLPERSISYYNKGEIVSVLLDLAVRDASNGRKSLRDIFQWLNENYARKGRFYPDSDGVRQAAEAVTGAEFQWFFRSFVAGTEPLPYDRLFRTAGLELKEQTYTSPDWGLSVSFAGGGFPIVTSVEAGSSAEEAGVRAGDSILQVNGIATADNWDRVTSDRRPGETLRVRVSGPGGTRDVSFELAGKKVKSFELVPIDSPTPAQRARRSAWLSGDAAQR